MLLQQQQLHSCYARMQQLSHKQQQRQQQLDYPTAAAAAGMHADPDSSSDTDSDSSSDSELDDSLDFNQPATDSQQQQQQQQQQCHGVSPNRQQLADQLDLLCCPETAAAAASDVRQSMFDFFDSQPWQLDGRDPPGLACQLYRCVVLLVVCCSLCCLWCVVLLVVCSAAVVWFCCVCCCSLCVCSPVCVGLVPCTMKLCLHKGVSRLHCNPTIFARLSLLFCLPAIRHTPLLLQVPTQGTCLDAVA
jgi:hypothetical protein